nr:unnamed protein product [Rangifer tarandus platyrhynchus]
MAGRAGLGPMAEVEACIGRVARREGGENGDVWSEWASSTVASPSSPLKFSQKITLQKQCQAEETAAFEEVIMDIGFTQLQAQKLRLAYTRSSHYGGSLPNVN